MGSPESEVHGWEPAPSGVLPVGPVPASPVPTVPSSRSGTPCRSSRRPRKISWSFSKCSEEAAEVAMAQVARELRSLRLRALGPLPPQQSAAQLRSHHCSLTSASGIRRFRGPPSRTPFPCCHCAGAGRRSLTESRGGNELGYYRGAASRQGERLSPTWRQAADTGEVPKRRTQGSPRDGRLGRLIWDRLSSSAFWGL